MNIIILLDHPWIIMKYIHLAVVLLGLNPIFFGDMEVINHLPREVLSRYQVYRVDTDSIEEMIKLIRHKNIKNIIAVTSFDDSKINSSIKLAKHLKVKGLDKTILTLSSKSVLKKLIPLNTPQSIIFSSNNIPKRTIKKFLKENKIYLLKPDNGYESRGIKEISLATNLEEKITKHIKDYPEFKKWHLQEKIKGKLLSIEGYCLDGIVHKIGYSKREIIYNLDMANHFPFDEEIKPITKYKSEKILNDLIKKSNFKRGYFHCEFIENGEEIYLIDGNFGRIGGGGIAEQISASFGHSPEEVIAHTISVGIFNKNIPHVSLYKSHPLNTICINYGLPEKVGIIGVELSSKLESYNTLIPPSIKVNFSSQLDRIKKPMWVGTIVGTKVSVNKELPQIRIVTTDGRTIKPIYFLNDKFNVLELK